MPIDVTHSGTSRSQPLTSLASVAQWSERPPVERRGAGSSPVGSAVGFVRAMRGALTDRGLAGTSRQTRASRLGRTDGRRRGEISAPGENPVTLRPTSGFHSPVRTVLSLLVQLAARLALDQEVGVRVLGRELEGRALACHALSKSVTGRPVGGSTPPPSAKR